MEVSDVRVRLVKDANERLKAVCSVTLDSEFVVRDVKVVEGTNGLFVAMPSRKLTSACPKCRTQNHLRARHCNECGTKLPQPRIPTDTDGREKVHRDIAHPITANFRQTIQQHVLDAFHDAAEEEGLDHHEDVEVENEEEQPKSEYDSIIADLRAGSRLDDGDKSDTGRDDRDRSADRKRRRRPREDRPEPATQSASDRRDRYDKEEQPEPKEPGPREPTFADGLDEPAGHDEEERDTVGAPVASSTDGPDDRFGPGDAFGPGDSFGSGDGDAESKRKDERDDEPSSFGEGLL
ncbi:MAG: SpoVG family protein [Phycisphaerae bacterium]|jgi:stage V sporulation protein G